MIEGFVGSDLIPRLVLCTVSAGPHCVDRKLDLLVKELKKFDVAVAGI